MNVDNINNDNEGRWGHDQSFPVDEGWGCLRGSGSSTRPFKTKGSWAYARRALSCNVPSVDPPRTEVRSLAVLAAEQVAAHMSEEDVLKLAPLHVNLICSTRMKWKQQDRGKGEWSPTPAQT